MHHKSRSSQLCARVLHPLHELSVRLSHRVIYGREVTIPWGKTERWSWSDKYSVTRGAGSQVGRRKAKNGSTSSSWSSAITSSSFCLATYSAAMSCDARGNALSVLPKISCT